MKSTITVDGSGRVVLPKSVRERLNLNANSTLRIEVVAGRIELTPVEDDEAGALVREAGILVLKPTGQTIDAALAVAAERDDMDARGVRR